MAHQKPIPSHCHACCSSTFLIIFSYLQKLLIYIILIKNGTLGVFFFWYCFSLSIKRYSQRQNYPGTVMDSRSISKQIPLRVSLDHPSNGQYCYKSHAKYSHCMLFKHVVNAILYISSEYRTQLEIRIQSFICK